MSLYYNNFKYLDENSLEKGLVVASFEPDDGFMDSFLSMEPIQEEYYDGSKKFDYGARYNSTAVVNITVVKNNNEVFSLEEVRSLSKWLTGSRVNSWLDVGPSIDDIRYSFLGRVTNLQLRKMDGRAIGLMIEFSSITPWAFSAPQSLDCRVHQALYIDGDGIIYNDSRLGLYDGTLHPSNDRMSYFNVTDDGTAYIDTSYRSEINNKSDDLYTYTYLDINYQNNNGTYISIKNNTLGEESLINNVSSGEVITISARQFIISNIPNKLFGDDFNFVWPRLKPGINHFVISGDGEGFTEITYRYPMKVGDCAMDIET